MLKPLRVLFCLLACCALAVQAQPLRAVVLSSRAAPFVLRGEHGVTGGLDAALSRLLADALGMPLQLLPLPALRLRIAAAAGDFDLVCGLDPQRLSGLDGLDWSPALGSVTEVLVGHRGAEPVDRLDQLPKGVVIGTLLGHQYPALAAGLAAGRWEREDALGEDRLVRKLAAQRHPYAVISALTPGAERQQGFAEGEAIADWRVPLGAQRYHCAVPAGGRVPAARVWQALQARQAEVRELLQAATAPLLAVVVSQQSPLRSLSGAELADLYLGRKARLAGGMQPNLTMLRGSERAAFLGLIRQQPGDYAAKWAALQFGGRARAPQELADLAALKARLQSDPLAIGYMPLSEVDARLRIVHLQ